MSLINQMLKDIEERRSENRARPETLSRRTATILPWLLAGILALATLMLGLMLWQQTMADKAQDRTSPVAVATEQPAAEAGGTEADSPGSNAETASDDKITVADANPGGKTAIDSSDQAVTKAELPALPTRQEPAEPAKADSSQEPAAESSTETASVSSEPEPQPATKPAQREDARASADKPDDAEADGSMLIAPTRLSPAEQAQASIQRGFEAMQRRDYREAVDEFMAGLSVLPQDDNARMALYRVLRRQGRVAEAEGVLEAGLADAKQPHRFASVLARNYAARGQVESAITLLALAPPPIAESPDYYALWGALLQQQGDYAAAVPVYEELVAYSPRNAAWQAGLGVALQQVDDIETAVEAYRNALDVGGLQPAVEEYVREQLAELAPEEE